MSHPPLILANNIRKLTFDTCTQIQYVITTPIRSHYMSVLCGVCHVTSHASMSLTPTKGTIIASASPSETIRIWYKRSWMDMWVKNEIWLDEGGVRVWSFVYNNIVCAFTGAYSATSPCVCPSLLVCLGGIYDGGDIESGMLCFRLPEKKGGGVVRLGPVKSRLNGQTSFSTAGFQFFYASTEEWFGILIKTRSENKTSGYV